MSYRLKISKTQYKYFASAVKTIAEGILLGSSAAFFLPETLQMRTPIALGRYLIIFVVGLTLLIGGAMLEKKGSK